MSGTDSDELKAGQTPDSDSDSDSNALALVPAVSTEDSQASLDPTAAAFVFESKLCPVTYSYHPYTKVANNGNAAIHGLGRPALTLQSTALVQPRVNTGVPRVYQSESRNMFVAEYERFKEVKLNLQSSFPSSMVILVSFDEWVAFRVKITEHRIQQLRNNIMFRTGRATAKKRALAHGPVPNYEVDTSRYPKPVIPFPRSIVGGRPPAATRKPNDVYFENWSKIGQLWGDDIEPMPRTYTYHYGQEAFHNFATGPLTGANPYSPKILPVGVMHGVHSSNLGPSDVHAPSGGTNAPGTGGTATPSSKAPEYPGFQGGGRYAPVPPFPIIPQPNGGYANDHYFRTHQGGGYQQNPNPGNWNHYNNVPLPNFIGGHYPGNRFGNEYYGRGPIPQARNQSAGYYGPNFNLLQPGLVPGALNPNFIPGGGPNFNFQQPGFILGAHNANFAQNGGHHPNFQKPGYAPGSQNNNFGQSGGPVPSYVPGSTTAPAPAPVPAPVPANYVNGSAGSAKNAPQQLAITGYAYESDDDFIPEDYEHEGDYDHEVYEGEEVGEEGFFDDYDNPFPYYHNTPDPIPELILGGPEEKEDFEPTEAQRESENAIKPE